MGAQMMEREWKEIHCFHQLTAQAEPTAYWTGASFWDDEVYKGEIDFSPHYGSAFGICFPCQHSLLWQCLSRGFQHWKASETAQWVQLACPIHSFWLAHWQVGTRTRAQLSFERKAMWEWNYNWTSSGKFLEKHFSFTLVQYVCFNLRTQRTYVPFSPVQKNGNPRIIPREQEKVRLHLLRDNRVPWVTHINHIPAKCLVGSFCEISVLGDSVWLDKNQRNGMQIWGWPSFQRVGADHYWSLLT